MHGASHTSSIGSTIESPRPPRHRSPEDEAQALFEEARRRARRRRRRRALLALVFLAAGMGAVQLVGSHGDDDSLRTRETVRAPGADKPTRLFVQLLTGTEPLAVANPVTGRIRFLPKLPTQGGDPLERLHYIGGRLVWWAGVTWSIDSSLRGPPKQLAEGEAIPSATPGRLWFLSDRERDGTFEAVEMTAAGRVTRRARLRPPRRCAIPLAVERGFLCQTTDPEGFLVLDLATGRAVRRLPGPFPAGAHGNLVAACDSNCRVLHLSDAATGRSRPVQPPESLRYLGGYDGAFSPDGALLAVPVKARRLRVALIDVRKGTASVVPGSRLAADYRKLAWSSAGELFFSAPDGKVMAYKPGARRARLLPLDFSVPLLDLAAS